MNQSLKANVVRQQELRGKLLILYRNLNEDEMFDMAIIPRKSPFVFHTSTSVRGILLRKNTKPMTLRRQSRIFPHIPQNDIPFTDFVGEIIS